MAKVLVIEDEVSVRANIAELLGAEDYDVITAENGFIGVLWAQEHLPDLVICDVMMPDLDGRDVLSALRQDPLTAPVPFIFLTARADKSDIRLGMDLGADDYLTKPFTRRELLGAVTARLEKYRAVERRYWQERDRANLLQYKIEGLQNASNCDPELLKDLETQFQQAVPKLHTAIQLLKKVPHGIHRDYCLQLLQETYADEIDLIHQRPELSELLAAEEVEVLRNVNAMVR
jgi:DNA-binding response OmpR family regulator